MSIFWSILDAWPSTVLSEYFNFLLSSELPYPSCQNYFHSPDALLRMEAGHREKAIVSLNPNGFKILLTSMPIAAWQHQSTRSHHSSQFFYYSQALCIRVPYTNPKVRVYSLLLSVQTWKQLGWMGSVSVSHLLPPHPFSVNPPWNPCFSNRITYWEWLFEEKEQNEN